MAETYRDITYGDGQAQNLNLMNAQSQNVGGQNVINYASQLVGDPSAFFSNDMKLGNQVPTMTGNEAGTTVDGSSANLFVDPKAVKVNTSTANVAQADQVMPKDTQTFKADTTYDRVTQTQNTMNAAKGEVRKEAVIDAPQADLQGLATGTNTDGSTNFTGQALGQYASQNIASVIDTSTVSGKLLAQTLGEGNYTDSKTTVKGQLDILSKEFTDPVTGEAKIPTWAAGVARSVSRIAAFKGMTGTAATAAMSQAIMEASLPIAQQDAQFFQTVTLKNLDNKQQQTINRANVLSKMELANLDIRMQTAVENSKNFMQMDLTNLSNEQQSRVINTQARIQSILEDAKSENTARMFAAESTNEMNRFYDNLRASISQFNTAQSNEMAKFNSGEVNDNSRFNATMENTREQFYKEMQYNIDISNAKWRQTVTLQNSEMLFNAYATDVKNMVGISSEAMNQLWDRSDALLDYAWKSSESSKELEAKIAMHKAEMQLQRDKIKSEASGRIWQAVGAVAGAAVGSVTGGWAQSFFKVGATAATKG